MAENNGELGYNCETRSTRNITSVDMLIPSGLASIDLCETHYQEFLRWNDHSLEDC
jgi:hypothetical protein